MTDGSKKQSAQLRRRRARLAAVQALYQMDLAQTNLEDVISEFSEFRLNQDTEEEPVQADEAFFKDLLIGVVRAQRDIDCGGLAPRANRQHSARHSPLRGL